jgi:hypothetical protein
MLERAGFPAAQEISLNRRGCGRRKSDARQEECDGSADVFIISRTFWRRMQEKDVLDERAAQRARSRVNRRPGDSSGKLCKSGPGSLACRVDFGLTGASSVGQGLFCPGDPEAIRTAVVAVRALKLQKRARRGCRVLLRADPPVLVSSSELS